MILCFFLSWSLPLPFSPLLMVRPRCDKFVQRLVLYPKQMGKWIFAFLKFLAVISFKAFDHKVFFFHFETSSAIFEMGNTKVIAAVYGPREVLFSYLPCLWIVIYVIWRWVKKLLGVNQLKCLKNLWICIWAIDNLLFFFGNFYAFQVQNRSQQISSHALVDFFF